jgi:tripartite-type tricarboxylate transporter receptor subunit TctC
MIIRKLAYAVLASINMCAAASLAYAQDYPTRPVQIITSVSIGSATDILARQLADKLQHHLGGTVIVMNKPGAGGTIAADFVAKSAPDGYTLFFGNSGLALFPFLYKKLPFDVLNDFAGIALIADSPYAVVVNNDLGVKNMKELFALAKAKPGTINFASGGFGSATHMACELLGRRAGVEFAHIPYSNTMTIATDLQSNNVQLMCSPPSSILPLLGGGRVTIIGVSSEAAMKEPVEAPSVKQATGVDFVIDQWFGLLAPKKTPDAVLQKLAAASKAVLEDADFIAKLKTQALEAHPLYLGSFDKFIAAELATWGPIVQATGVTLDK